VSDAPAPDRGAIAFAEKLMTVLAYGRKTATCKYAVLLALIDLCHEQSSSTGSAPRRVRTAQLAEKVIELYWPHTAPFEAASGALPTQNSGGRQAEILQLIRRFRDEAVRDPSASRTRSRMRAPEAYAAGARGGVEARRDAAAEAPAGG
jgi:hypothetical protein